MGAYQDATPVQTFAGVWFLFDRSQLSLFVSFRKYDLQVYASYIRRSIYARWELRQTLRVILPTRRDVAA